MPRRALFLTVLILAVLIGGFVVVSSVAFACHGDCGDGSVGCAQACDEGGMSGWPLCVDSPPSHGHLVDWGTGKRDGNPYCGGGGNCIVRHCYTDFACDGGYDRIYDGCEASCVGNQGQACQSSPNSCGMRNNGTIQCNGSCSAGPPSNNLCTQGSFDGFIPSCVNATGWSWDRDATNSPVPVKLYDRVPGPAITPVVVLSPITYRNDLNNAVNGNPSGLAGNGNHAFNWAVPTSYKDNIARTFYAYAVNIDAAGAPTGAPDTLIGTRNLQCNDPAVLTVDTATCTPDPLNTTVTVTGSATDVPAAGALITKLYKTSATPANLIQTGSATPGFNMTGGIGPFAGSVPASYTVITEVVDGQGGAPTQVSRTVVCNPPVPVITMSATPPAISYGGTTQIAWNAANATGCTATAGSAGWPGARPAAGTYNTPALLGPTTFTVTCTNVSGSAVKSVAVAVAAPPPPTVSITKVDQPDYCQTGPEAIATWQYQSVALPRGQWQMQVATNPGFTTIVYDSGIVVGRAETIPTTAQEIPAVGVGHADIIRVLFDQLKALFSHTLEHLRTSFSMTEPTLAASYCSPFQNCFNDGDCDQGYCQNRVCQCDSAPSICGDRCADRGYCQPGACGGNTIHVTDCRGIATGGGGGVISYCDQPAATPTPPPPPPPPPPPAAPTITFTGTPTSIQSGTTSSLNWSSTNASGCTASSGDTGWPGAKATSGGYTTQALTATKTYSLTCTGPGGAATKSVTVTVIPPPTLVFNGSPTSIANGATTVLSWTSSNATGCTATAGSAGWPGAKSTTGNHTTVPLILSTTYILACSGSGGTVTQSVTITVAGSSPTPTPSVTPPPTPTPTPTPNPVNTTYTSSTGQGKLAFGQTYWVRIRAWDSLGTVSAWSPVLSFATPANAYPTADFTVSPEKPIAELNTTFTDTSAYNGGTPTSIQWDFGDGGTAATNPATHMYADANSAVTVTMRITSSVMQPGQFCSAVKALNVQKPIPTYKEVRPGSVPSSTTPKPNQTPSFTREPTPSTNHQ